MTYMYAFSKNIRALVSGSRLDVSHFMVFLSQRGTGYPDILLLIVYQVCAGESFWILFCLGTMGVGDGVGDGGGGVACLFLVSCIQYFE